MGLEESSEDQLWICAGMSDINAVKVLALQELAQAIDSPRGTLFLQDVHVECKGHNLFHVSPRYGTKKREEGTWTWDYDTQGGTFNIKASRETVNRYVPQGKDKKDHKGAIGVQTDGTVEGVNIIVPSMKLNVTYNHPKGVVTLDWAYKVADLTGCTNSKPMLGRKAGEVLFLGGRGSDGSDAAASCGYSFAVEKNLRDQLIGGIQVAAKDGHDYAWIEFEKAIDANQPVTPPRQISVERVYERVDLAAALGFGR